MVAIAIRMYFISFKLINEFYPSIICGIIVSLLLWGIGYIRDKKILVIIAIVEISLTLTVFWFEMENIQSNKQKEIVQYNDRKDSLIEEKYRLLVKQRQEEIVFKTIKIPEPYLKNCPTHWFNEGCETGNLDRRNENNKKYSKEIAFNQSLSLLPYPDKTKILVFVPEPSNDNLQRIIISLLFNLSIPILYFFLGSNIAASSNFNSIREEALFRYNNRTTETVNEICRDMGIPVSSLYFWLNSQKAIIPRPIESPIGDKLETNGKKLEPDRNPLESFRGPLESRWNHTRNNWNNTRMSLEVHWKRIVNYWKATGKPLESFGNSLESGEKSEKQKESTYG